MLRILPTSLCTYQSKSQHSMHKYSTQFSEFKSRLPWTQLYRYTCVCSAVLAQDMTPIFGYIFGQEGVALCQRRSVSISGSFVPGFWTIILDTQQICEHILSIQTLVVICLKFIFNGTTWRAGYCIYLFIYACCTTVFLNNPKLSSSNITEFF